ncbi:MAG: WG repeat-containing protein [Bacteroidota bacterium]|nr:WG repeat-containing protein [Bacteroidota bacterium]
MNHCNSTLFKGVVIFLIIVQKSFLTCSALNATNVLLSEPIYYSEVSGAGNTAISSTTYSIVEKDNKKGLADEKGTLVIPAKYDDLGWTKGTPLVIGNVIGYKENNSWGLINTKNQRVTAPLYSKIEPYNEDLLIAAKRISQINQSMFGVINTKGKAVVPFNYLFLAGNEGALIAGKDKSGITRYGLIDMKNNVLIPFDFISIKQVSKNRFSLKNGEEKVSMVDSKGFRLIGFELDSIGDFSGNIATVYLNGKKGKIDNEGKFVLKPIYKDIFEENFGYRALHYPSWKLLDAQNHLVNNFEYDEMFPADSNTYKIKLGEKMAIVDAKDNFLMPAVNLVGVFENKIAIFIKKNKYGVVDHRGKVIIKPEYDSVRITDTFILGMKRTIHEKWSVFNHQGDSLTERTYQEVKSEKPGLLGVKRNDSWGFINEKGKEIIPNQYDSVENFQGQVTKATFLGSEGVINNQGEWLANPWHEFVQPVSENIFYFRSGKKTGLLGPGNKQIYTTENAFFPINSGFIEKNAENKLGLVNKKGIVILKVEYDEISHLQGDSIYIFKKDGKFGIVTTEGKIKVGLNSRFQELHPLKDNYLGVKINHKYGFVDINGDLRISNQYDAIGYYQEGLAPIKLRGNWGYIDKIERIIIQPAFDHAYNFSDGLAIVMKNNKYGLVNKAGKIVLPLEYDRLEKTKGKNYLCFLNEKVGLTNEQGRLMVFPKFDAIEDLHNGYLIIKRQNKFGLLSNSGVDTIPMIYDTLIYDHYNDLYLCGTSTEMESLKNK